MCQKLKYKQNNNKELKHRNQKYPLSIKFGVNNK